MTPNSHQASEILVNSPTCGDQTDTGRETLIVRLRKTPSRSPETSPRWYGDIQHISAGKPSDPKTFGEPESLLHHLIHKIRSIVGESFIPQFENQNPSPPKKEESK